MHFVLPLDYLLSLDITKEFFGIVGHDIVMWKNYI